ncbi:eukaryotic membrane protein family-domain-containing protein [Dissophora ornata]|nr:eukaryotic membrane protein family-domain-containing protein [Dissophora ornata]
MSAQRPSSPTRLTPNGPSKKHGKKKSRNSWKAGFKSTPSSPSQSTLDTHSSVLTEITAKTININSESSNINISNSNNNNSSRIIGNISDRDKGITSNSGINTVNINDGVKSIASINSISTGNINDSVKGATSISDISASNINGNAKGVTSSGLIPNNSNDNDDSSHHIVTTNANNINIGAGASSNKGSDNANISGNSRSSDQSSGGSYSTNTHGSTDTNRLPMALLDDLRLKDLIGSISPSHSTTVSLWDYLKEELTAADFETTQELKRERVANFLSVPIAFEKMIVFGYFVCLDSFLYTFTILPARFFLATSALFRYIFSRTFLSTSVERTRLKSSQKCDLIKVTLVVVACTILQSVDASRTYHFIRGQNAMKLYAIFNCLEIFDRLCCSFGQDILDSLFSKSTLGSHPPKASHSASRHARPITFVILAILYILAHTMVLFFQMVTLNVAVNSYSNALLTLLISNQFVEIKGSVFKKFEKENLFQLSCSDIVERFQLSVFVAIITIRNLVELSASPPSPFSVYPQSFVPLFSSMTAVARLLTPCFLVLGCETLVDWLKHAFITKFNQIRPSVYGRFVDILSRDLVVGSPAQLGGRNNHQRMFVDQSPMVSRRIGLAALPLACLVICVTIQTLQMVFSNHPSDLGQAPVVVAETIVASAVSFETISFEWTMPVVDFSSGLTVALSGVMVVVDSYFKFAWAVLNQSVAVFVHVVLAWIHRAGISQELGRRVVEYAVVALACLATYACLVALKLLIGINLLGFAYHRYLTMESREEVERQTDRMMRESNAAVEEKAVSAAVSSLLDGRGAGHANGDAYVLGGEKRVTHGLDTIDRYTLFKSRIP